LILTISRRYVKFKAIQGRRDGHDSISNTSLQGWLSP
jgi:hypothetical protein